MTIVLTSFWLGEGTHTIDFSRVVVAAVRAGENNIDDPNLAELGKWVGSVIEAKS